MKTSPLLARAGLVAAGLSATFALAHCSTEPASPAAAQDAGELPDPVDSGGFTIDGDGGLGVVGSGPDAGTIDSGRDASAVTVCGGGKGNPNAVPLLDWELTYGRKYAVPVGGQMVTSEPLAYGTTALAAIGSRAESGGYSASSTVGVGPFNSGRMTRDSFVSNAMPPTELGFGDPEVGWSGTSGAVFDLATSAGVGNFKAFSAGGVAMHVRGQRWSLLDAKRAPSADDNASYASVVTAARGGGWVFVAAFDAPCKLAEFEALIGSPNPLVMLEPPAPTTLADVSRFLVDNDARLRLRVMYAGDKDPAIEAALSGTQASAATLDALRATMTAFDAAWQAYLKSPVPIDHDSVAGGTNPDWVVGSIVASPVASLPPAP